MVPEVRRGARRWEAAETRGACGREGPGVESGAVAGNEDKAVVLTEVSLILAAVFWGLNFAATKFAALSIPPLLLVAFRFCIGGMLRYGILRVLEPRSRLGREDLLPMAALGCLGVVTTQPDSPSA